MTVPAPLRALGDAQMRRDLWLAVGLFVAAIVSAWLGQVAGFYGEESPPFTWALVYAAALTLPVALRRRYPEIVLVIVAVAFFVGVTLRIPEVYVANVALFLAMYTVGASVADRRRATIVRLLVIVGMFVWLLVTTFQTATDSSDDGLSRAGLFSPFAAFILIQFLVNAAFFGGAYFFGERAWADAQSRRALEERTAELERERELTAAQAVALDRVRIARELHDVVAHGMSLIQVQASTARYRVPGLSDDALHEFDEISQTAREGLTEMRRLLGVLRTDDHEADLAPQQGLRDLPDLVQALRRAGAEIEADLEPAPEGVPSAVDIAAFRIVQEALSNAVRHAPQARIDLTVRSDAAAVRILVRNAPSTAATTPDPSPQRGHGILGMRERAALVGGTVDTGPDADGGWTVRAALPLAPPPPDPTPGGAA